MREWLEQQGDNELPSHPLFVENCAIFAGGDVEALLKFDQLPVAHQAEIVYTYWEKNAREAYAYRDKSKSTMTRPGMMTSDQKRVRDHELAVYEKLKAAGKIKG